ncbi:hypothetical protein B0A48_16875 [Cryoendolithus antarcticus]|uniref:Serine hydrolase domain-containing protein n=1 Tax=Cryoendolithus antarcticus TaxID=1507870 RepID=A0A1V8SE10_9PEZI|nr:hypothetical protein B0A48_16875 [Cryoendolithus antarcticus]
MKILVLHGESLRRNIGGVLCRIEEAVPNATFSFPTAHIRLQPRQHGVTSSALDLRGWFEASQASNPPDGLMTSVEDLVLVLEYEGPFAGIIALSLGTILAAMLAALLHGGTIIETHEEAIRNLVEAMPYPECFAALRHAPLRFLILCAARAATESYYEWLFQEDLGVRTCYVVGDLDSVVSYEDWGAVPKRLIARGEPVMIVHPDGHHLPTDRPSQVAIV